MTGDFTGTFDESEVSGPLADGAGTTIIDTTGTAKGCVSVSCCVTPIAHPALDDWTGSVCGSN